MGVGPGWGRSFRGEGVGVGPEGVWRLVCQGVGCDPFHPLLYAAKSVRMGHPRGGSEAPWGGVGPVMADSLQMVSDIVTNDFAVKHWWTNFVDKGGKLEDHP